MALDPGHQLLNGHYRILRLLGRGGFGFVYHAQDTLLGEQVAIKELIPALVGDEAMLKRFLAEARATMRLTHRHIVRTHNVFQEGDNYYIVMEYMAGGSLEERLREQGPLPVEEAVRIAAEVCEGLACAHEEGVVHCDLKPANILFDTRGQAKVADFGIAHVSGEMLTRSWMTPAGFVAGTLPYMSPEQADGVRDDPRIDVYALGAVLYRTLTGRTYLDFDQRETPRAQMENLQRIYSQQPEAPSAHKAELPAWLDAVILTALAKRPGERFSSADALRAALLQAWGTSARHPQAWPPTRPLADQDPDLRPIFRLPSDSDRGVSRPDRRPALPAWFWPAAGATAVLLILLVVAIAALVRGGDREAVAGTNSTAAPTSRGAVVTDLSTRTRVPPTPVPTTPVPTRTPTVEIPEVGFAVMPDGYLERAILGEFAGAEVVVDGLFTKPDDTRFAESMAAFEEATGITVDYVGDREFWARIQIRVDAADPPDIADFPTLRLLATFAREGRIVDPTTWIPGDWLKQQYNQSWLDMATMPGPDGQPMSAGVWHRFNGKSLVWYPKDDWDAAGYEIPGTWDELMALTQQIADDGDTAWCVGIESGAATGWIATDWTEEMMLRTASLADYDAWVAGDLPFSSPQLKKAIQTWSEVWFDDDYVYGGRDSIVSTFFGDAPSPMFEDPPKCWLHRQGSFVPGFFPEGAELGVDYDFFYLPPVDERYGKPFLIAGDIMSMFNDRPEVRALMEYLTTRQSVSGWLWDGGALAAHQTARPDMYGAALERRIAELVADATSFRFDGSDLMPGEVGAGSFWKGMTDYVSGAADLDTVLLEIDESWPR